MENNKKTNTYAIVGFICSFFVPILGLIFSIIGLNKVKEYNDGKGFSIAGIIISAIRTFLAIVSIVLLFIFGFAFATDIVPEVIDEIETEKSGVLYGYPQYNDESVVAMGDFFELAKDEAGNIIDFTEVYNNKSVNIDYLNFTLNCEEKKTYLIDGVEKDICTNMSIKNYNNIIFNVLENDMNSYTVPYVVLSDEYFIIQGISNNTYETNEINIYDINGNLLKTISNTIAIYNGAFDRTYATLLNGKVYFTELEDSNTITIKYYDIKKDKIVLVHKLKNID